MAIFILRRLAQSFWMLLLLSFFSYNLLTLMPGDPVEMLAYSNPNITAADIAHLRQLYGLDTPAWKRYLKWMDNLIKGDLGYSRTYRVPVKEIILPRLANTFILSMSALFLSLLIAIPLGIFMATKPQGRFNTFFDILCFAGISMPTFWIGILLILLFSVKLGWLPASGTQTVGANTLGVWETIQDRGKYLLLPMFTLSLYTMGRYLRYAKTSMREAIQNDFIRTARAKGLPESLVIWKHGFRNALIPIITILALSLSTVFSGALITETVFSYQGVGKLVYDSIQGNDYNVAMIAFMISIVMVLLMNLLADILYQAADPRIRLAARNSR